MAIRLFGQKDSEGHNYVQVTPEGALETAITGVQKISGVDGIDSSTNTLQIIDYAHHEIHSGSFFRVQNHNDAVAVGGNINICFTIPEGTKLPHMLWTYVTGAAGTMTAYRGVTLTLGTGTDVSCKNSRLDSTKTSVLQGVGTGALADGYVSQDATWTGGSVFSLKKSYVGRAVGSQVSRTSEIVLAAGESYAFVLQNDNNQPAGLQIRLEWYEHTDKN